MIAPYDQYIFEHAKESYEYQLDRCDKIRERVIALVKVFALLGAGIVFLWSQYAGEGGWNAGVDYAFFIPSVVASVLYLLAVFKLVWVLGWGFTYEYLKDPAEIVHTARELAASMDKGQGYVQLVQRFADETLIALQDECLDANDIREHLSNIESVKEELNHVWVGDPESEMKSQMADLYVKAAVGNQKVNRRRMNAVLRGIQLGILSFVFLLWAFSVVVYSKVDLPLKSADPFVSMSESPQSSENRPKPSVPGPAPRKPRVGDNDMRKEASQQSTDSEK
ncbi:hypothetical protein [Sulfuriroseicoccus oceanibius]|uniref:Uncharacterized protein n=1 Tax=Sulfuriroseicoccus oceanibius TaxID=2707525 RepID=A0A6B3LDA2_9BACT|nr:hypothetical protein [Sulfuriroseicoccus oceanibius]QQL45052.1 hypothetical protein G3M56_000240 [Sulfuriroseicoccus oceanibius]